MHHAEFTIRYPLEVPDGASAEEKLRAACELADRLDLPMVAAVRVVDVPSPATDHPQHMRALDRANEIRLGRAAQRDALRGQPPEVIRDALIDPPSELATYTIGQFFVGPTTLIAKFGPTKLQRALHALNNSRGNHYRNWRTDLRLRDLSPAERRALADAVIAAAPRAWREGR